MTCRNSKEHFQAFHWKEIMYILMPKFKDYDILTLEEWFDKYEIKNHVKP